MKMACAMKVKFKKGNVSKAAELVVTSGKGDELRYTESQDVQSGAGETLLAFGYEKCKNGRHRFSYYLGNQEPVSTLLKRVIPAEYFYSMLSSFVSLAKVCESKASLSLKRVCFDVDYIFYDARRSTLVFMYVPLQTPDPFPYGVLDALGYVLERAQPDKSYAQQVRVTLLDYVRSCNGIFSRIDFETRLKELGLVRLPGVAPVPSPDPSTGPIDSRGSHGYDFVREQMEAGEEARRQREAEGRLPQAYALSLDDGSTRWRLEPGNHVLGRSADCDISIGNIEGLSRRHAMITVESGCCFVEDLGSVNGTAVNGRRLERGRRCQIYPGDVLQFSTRLFTLGAD